MGGEGQEEEGGRREGNGEEERKEGRGQDLRRT